MIVFQVLSAILSIYQFILLGRILISWFPDIDRSNPIVQFLFDATEPVLRPIREMLPPSGFGGLDLSPMVVVIGIYVLQMILPG
ncbi:MAG: YggT family protein [Anaerolineae bacterium]|nr:YggT family protein [Anaerolineae bacterium]